MNEQRKQRPFSLEDDIVIMQRTVELWTVAEIADYLKRPEASIRQRLAVLHHEPVKRSDVARVRRASTPSKPAPSLFAQYRRTTGRHPSELAYRAMMDETKGGRR